MSTERELQRILMANADSFEARYGGNNADGPALRPNAIPAKGNPSFDAQFNLNVYLKFYSENAGVYTAVAPGALPATLQTKLNAFIFGNSDFSSGYAKMESQFPLAGAWNYDVPFIYNKGYATSAFSKLDATVTAQLQPGDLVIGYYATVAGTNYIGQVIVRSGQVPFGTLLDSTNSDTFDITMIRYVVPTSGATDLAQYLNNIFLATLSLFGKYNSDTIDPNAYKVPEQMQSNIIDIPVVFAINKMQALAVSVNHDVTNFQWNVFVNNIKKLI